MQVGAASTSLESAAFDSESKKKFVLWLAMERERRHKAEMTLNDASEVGQLSRMFLPIPRRALPAYLTQLTLTAGRLVTRVAGASTLGELAYGGHPAMAECGESHRAQRRRAARRRGSHSLAPR
jgi:hypothetical protein